MNPHLLPNFISFGIRNQVTINSRGANTFKAKSVKKLCPKLASHLIVKEKVITRFVLLKAHQIYIRREKTVRPGNL